MALQDSRSVFCDRQLVAFQSIRQLEIKDYDDDGAPLSFEFLLDLKNLTEFTLFIYPHFISAETIHLAAELFKRNPNLKKFEFLHVTVRRSDSSGLIYNGKHFDDKTPETIFAIFMQRLPQIDHYRAEFGSKYLAKYCAQFNRPV